MKLHAGVIAKQLRQDKSRIQQSAAAEPHPLVNAVLYVVGIPGAEIVDAIQLIHSIFFQPTEAQVDVLGQIEKLSELKEKGILSDEEFNSKKEELLKKL